MGVCEETIRGRRLRTSLPLVPAIGWFVFELLELSSKLEKSDIRVDLLATWPTVIGLSVIFTVLWAIDLKRAFDG